MNHQEVLSVLNRLLPEVVRTGDAEGTLLKCAMEENHSPAQLQRLCQTYNTAKTLAVLEKYANDRGRAFALISPEVVLSRYAEMRKQAGNLAPAPAPAPRPSYYDRAPVMAWAPDSDTVSFSTPKAAAATGPAEDPRAKRQELQRARHDLAEALTAGEFLLDVGFNAGEVCGEKIASFVRSHFSGAMQDGAAFATVEEDFYGLAHGDMAQKKAFVDCVAGHCNAALMRETVKRAGVCVDRAFVRDRTGAASLLVEAWNELQLQPAARELYAKQVGVVAELSKRAAFLEAAIAPMVQNDDDVPSTAGQVPDGEFNQTGAGEGGGRVFDYVPGASGSDSKALADEAFNALSKFRDRTMNLAAGVPEAYNKGLSGLTDIALGKTDAQLDGAADQDRFRQRAAATLAELQVRDPIISKADPNVVSSLASTILRAAPSIASDRNTLLIALREAVQYGAVPLHTLKELAEIEARMNPKPRAGGPEERT